MEVQGRTGWNYNFGQFEAAERCLLRAAVESDPCIRSALGKAGLKYLAGALGIGGETAGQAASPALIGNQR
jgi:hypothetical protein